MRELAILLLVCSIDFSICRPAEEPTRFTLNIGAEPTKNARTPMTSELDQARMLASESHNVAAASVAKSSVSNEISRSNYRPSTRETIRLENEQDQAILERPKSNPLGSILESFLSPTPVVDGIKEQEKYGNTGDRFIGIGRALVGGFEGLSNFLNAIIDLPAAALKRTSKGITGALNNVGARIVGLA